ncbi:hypothetical protein OA58_11665 [Microcystis aeruginosa NIES-88]|nr:hypothetical protein OA58_11665 [Microcystis aeruginosa NIES-88]BCU09960.1 hypothetical protein MAN88_05240 [Microcystis aeruginosa]BCU13682.1 hypothetical protein MAN88_42460 [Microcystis aeruginosa]
MRWYSYRWLIERYHFVLKSGCGLEKLQLETGRRIEMALATYSIVAWRLLWLTYQARLHGEESCESFLEEHEWQSLCATIHKKSGSSVDTILETVCESYKSYPSRVSES